VARSAARTLLRRCLERKVRIVVKGETNTVILRPGFTPLIQPQLESPKLSEGPLVEAFRLKPCSKNPPCCARRRLEPDHRDTYRSSHGQPQALRFDLRDDQPYDARTDLWLRDGDRSKCGIRSSAHARFP